ncbi:MAG: hypothetical protein U0572_00635 [Phycisphaerales bacterium]
MEPTSESRPGPLEPMTWAGLLSRWMEITKASVALPETGDAGRWKRSIPSFIELQATICALGELAAIPEPDRPLARDRAEIVVRRAAQRLHRVWSGAQMPEELVELERSAQAGLSRSFYAGLVEIVWPGPGVLEVPEVDLGELRGTLAMMPPGSLAMPREPVAWLVERAPVAIVGCVARAARGPRQVYRELDESGRFVRDIIAPLDSQLRAGLPMILPITLDGTQIGRSRRSRDEWLAMQRAAMEGVRLVDGAIPVIEADWDADD